MTTERKSGGVIAAEVLAAHGIPAVFTLCGGHISPILVESENRGIRIVDVRDEASAAFAADAMSRLTGTPGVCAVTAGPGLTNTITAVKNAQMAQSPLVVLGGATGTILKGRGSLQDIDQMALMEPHVKWMRSVERVADIAPALIEAIAESRRDVPGPVFVELPVDLLYEEPLVRDMYGVGAEAKKPRGLGEWGLRQYLRWHLRRQFKGSDRVEIEALPGDAARVAEPGDVRQLARALVKAKRPVALIGSQAVLDPDRLDAVVSAVDSLGIPFYLSGMARGLMGREHPRWMRHKRRMALKEADTVLLAGVPADFRLDYGRHVSRRATLLSVNLSPIDLTKNRKPNIGVLADPGWVLERLGAAMQAPDGHWDDWIGQLRTRDEEREADIASRAEQVTDVGVNPLHLCREIDKVLDDDSVLVADGGDFVATASYILRPRGPLRWLDPGVFGTLGVGGGFALAAKLAQPSAEVWLLWGDGSAAYTLAEFDSYARHGLPVIAVVGNDAGWTQIAREQVEILGADTACRLAHSDYHRVAEGYGGKGLKIERPEDIPGVLAEAKELAAAGSPVLINAIIGTTDFRKGSISM
ncbi:MAG: thiamine pyrophosphate-binding protein [Acidobacteriota bacterium]